MSHKARRLIAVLALLAPASSAVAGDGTWNTTANPAAWNLNTNWVGNTIADGTGSTADFSQVNPTADTTVNLTVSRTIGHLNFGDTNSASPASWILAGSGTTLTLDAASPTITVNELGANQTTSITALLAGTNGFTKAGSGTLVLNNAGNSISGVISLSSGTLAYANVGSLGTGSLSFTGDSILKAGASATVTRAISIASGIAATYDTNSFNTTLSGALTGSGTLAKNGGGTLTLTAGLNNTFSGPIMVNQGRLVIMDGFSHKNMTGQVTVASGATFFYGQNFQNNNLTSSLNLSGPGDGGYGALHLDYNAYVHGAITLAADATISHDYNLAKIESSITGNNRNLTLDSRIKGQSALTINGNISLGTGTLNKIGVNSVTLNGTNSYGSMLITTGAVYFQNAASMGGSGANITIQNNGVAARNGTDLDNLMLRVNTASTGAVAFGGSSTTASNALNMTTHPSLSIGTLGTMAYSGTITPGGGNYRLGGGGGTLTVSSGLSGAKGLIIQDAQGGTVILTGSLGYTGATVVKQGTLRMTGSFSGGITIESPGILRLSPNTATGTIATSQSFVSNGTLSLRINRGQTPNSDRIDAASIALGGTLSIVNEGSALEVGDSFQLFATTGGITRNGLILNLPALPAGLSWNSNNLYKTGVLTVATTGSFITEVGDPDHPELLSSEISAVYNSGQASVIINPGTYHFADGFEYQSAITLTLWSNFTINANNVMFTVGKQRAFVLDRCTNVNIKGLTIRARYPSATQGRVHATGTENGTAYAIWKISDSYPLFVTDSSYNPVADELKAGFAINVVDGTTGRINVAAGDTYGCIMTPHDNGTWKVKFTGKASVPMAVNDWLVTRIDGSLGQSHGIFLYNSTNCTLEAVRSQSGGFATFFESGGGGNKLIDCTIECSPVPPVGTTVASVVSCAADGVHARNAYPGMYIENLTTTGVLLDDCIAIHGFFQDVTAVSGNTITVSSRGKLEVNDYVRIAHSNGFFDQATCTAIENLGVAGYRITLDKTLAVPLGSKVCNPKYDGDGFRILNCNLSGTRSRAIIAKADNGVISGCTFDDSGTAVRLGSDYWWNESGYGWNVMVENNTILNCRQAVDVHSDGARGNRNITIRNNTIAAMSGYALNIAGCDGVTISSNSFGVPATAEIMNFSDSSNVTLANNLVAYSATGKSILKGVANVTNLQGQHNGALYSGRAYALTNSLSSLLLANPASNAAGGWVQQYSACNASGRWILQPDGTGHVKILSAANALALGVNNASTGGTPLVLETPGNGAGQLWTLKPVDTATIELVNKLSGLSATVTSNTLGETVNQSTGASNPGQLWSASFHDYNYATWRAASGASSNPLVDDDQDGVSNLLEYALAPTASAPLTSPSIIPLTVSGQTDNYLTLSCNRRVAATDILFLVEYSSDLITWQPTAVLVSSTPNPDGTTREVWRVPNAASSKGFLRVRTPLAN